MIFQFPGITKNPQEKESSGERLPIMKYCQPQWFAEEEKFSFQIV